MRLGTGAIEIKSGYGLTIDGELKCLVIKRMSLNYPISIKATFLSTCDPLIQGQSKRIH
jgi:imidazolonepropionase